MTTRTFTIVRFDPMRLVTDPVHEVTAHVEVMDAAGRHSELSVLLASAEHLNPVLFDSITVQTVLASTPLPDGLTPTGMVRVVESSFQPTFGVIGAGGSGPIFGHLPVPRDIGRSRTIGITGKT
jgi:hypothetical protein